MIKESLRKLTLAALAIESVREGASITVRFAGNADMAATTPLAQFFEQLQKDVVATGTRRVVCDFEALYFMNSSCFKCFIVWISRLANMDAAKRCRAHFRGNPNLHWQKRSLESLRAFGPSVVTVEVGPLKPASDSQKSLNRASPCWFASASTATSASAAPSRGLHGLVVLVQPLFRRSVCS